MNITTAKPSEWLTDHGLTPAGEAARKAFSKFTAYMDSLPIYDFQNSRAAHLLQSFGYHTIPDGYALPPRTINLSLNNRCNLRCSYCDLNREREHWDEKNPKAQYSVIDPDKKYELPFETCKEIIDRNFWFRPIIRAHWMESLLYSDLIPLIEYAKGKGLPFSMITNGLLLTKFASRLAEKGVDILRISLDGPADIHDELCGVKGAYDQIIAGLKMLVDENKKRGRDMQMGAYFTVTDRNYDRMLDLVEDLERHELLDHMFLGFYLLSFISKEMVEKHNREHASRCGVEVMETSSQYVDLDKIDHARVIAQKDEIQKRYVSKGARISFRPSYTEDNLDFCLSTKAVDLPKAKCEAHWHSVCINPEGMVKPMTQCFLDPVGNINGQTLLDAWNGETIREQRLKLQKYGAYHGCMRCWSIYSSIEEAQGSWK